MLDLNKQLEEQIELYNKRIEAVNEKERQYDQLIKLQTHTRDFSRE